MNKVSQFFFSGNEGFHIYVPKSEYEDVGSRERAEIADYIMFRGTIPETFGFRKFNMNKSSLPKFEDEWLAWKTCKAFVWDKIKSSKNFSRNNLWWLCIVSKKIRRLSGTRLE